MLAPERLAELRHVAEQAASMPAPFGPWWHRYHAELVPAVVLELLDALDTHEDTEEWSAFIWEQDNWRPVGVSGTRETAVFEMEDWHQEVPDARLTLGYRAISPWNVPAEAGG